MLDKWEASEGAPSPLGASWIAAESAYNFALYSKDATAVTLLLYGEQDFSNPVCVVPFHFPANKTGRVWHKRVSAQIASDVKYYAYRLDGPLDPHEGQRFDADKILLDPYAKGVFFPPGYSREAAIRAGSNAGQAPLGVLPDRQTAPEPSFVPSPRHGHDLVIYELHVRGFTRRGNSGVAPSQRGSFAGLVAKIPYLQELGITAVELMPIHQFEPGTGNYWGYMSINFFSPHAQYGSDGTPAGALREFRLMIDEFHRAGIEVFLDVVYNHTAEMGAGGPTYSFRGIDNSAYYALSPIDLAAYVNYSGCGNDLRASHPIVRRLIVDSLRYWAKDVGVDGFRFDLASIFARGEDGSLSLDDPPIISEISSAPELADVRLIAEPWDDSEGGYLMGRAFPGTTWRQWNDHFRDTARRFMRGDAGLVADLMTRLYGSTDLFRDTKADAYRRYQSVNFVTAHDGLNLFDLVSYTNLSQNSWNCGHEGNIEVPVEVALLRRRQAKNLCCLLMLSNGTPMFVAGDEFLHTQGGCANPYDQDNETTWLNWDLADANADILRFFRMMIGFRKAHPSIARSTGWGADVTWHGTSADPDLTEASRSVAFHLRGRAVCDRDLYVMISGYWDALTFAIQAPGQWRRVVDTGLESPEDILEESAAPLLGTRTYDVAARSTVVLVSDPGE